MNRARRRRTAPARRAVFLCLVAGADALASPWIRPDVRNLLGPASPSTLAKYTLPREVITEGWSAQFVSRTAKSFDEGTSVEVIPKDPQVHFVDGAKVEVPIPNLNAPGLGIELLELQGGREDGLGITIVNGLVPGGNAERACEAIRRSGEDGQTILYGDSIVEAVLVLQRAGGKTDVTSVKTECLGYDATVAALVDMLGLIDANGGSVREASVVLTLKRLLRRPDIRVKVQYPPSDESEPETLRLQPGDNLRLAMLRRGVKLNDPLARRYDGKRSGGNCGGGALCRTCAVSVLRGGELLSRPKENEKKMLSEMEGARWRLSCKSWVGYGMEEGEVVIQVNPRQW